jgi:phosphate transport system permease protein
MNKPVRSDAGTPRRAVEIVKASLPRRQAAERRFRWYGLSAIIIGLLFLGILFADIVSKGYSAFWQTKIALDVFIDPQVVDPEGRRDAEQLERGDYAGLIRSSLSALFPEVKGRVDKRLLNALVSSGAEFELRERVLSDPAVIGETVPLWVSASADVDMYVKGHVDSGAAAADQRLKAKQIAWIEQLRNLKRVSQQFNSLFFSAGDSREPEQAGIWGAVTGSFFTLLVTLTLSLPIGIAAAIYLEEFAPRNRLTDIIEVNINNLAAVPSIVFGLLGLAIFINFFELPRSSPLVGGLVLALMTLPVIIIAARSALKSVPPSIREGALGVGASPMQTVFHHVLPLALPGMMTGAIIGMARALGESAPLLMIGMVAFIVDIPRSTLSPATVLPVQIYLWADSPERAFVERTSAAILVLLAFLILMNGLAVYLRKRYERRW